MRKRMLAFVLALLLALPLAASGQAASTTNAQLLAEHFFDQTWLENTSWQMASVKRGDDGLWVATYTAADAEHRLVFDDNGRIHQYTNSAHQLLSSQPDVAEATDYLLKRNISTPLDNLLMDMRGYGYNTGYVIAADRKAGIYVYALEIPMEAYVMFREKQGKLTLLAYSDMNTSAGRYGSYLSRGEAVEKARESLVSQQFATAYQASRASVMQTMFSMVSFYDNNGALMEYAIWYVNLVLDGLGNDIYQAEIEPQGYNVPAGASVYSVMIDAETGEMQYVDTNDDGNG